MTKKRADRAPVRQYQGFGALCTSKPPPDRTMSKPKTAPDGTIVGLVSDREHERLSGLSRRLGRRLSLALTRMPDPNALPDPQWLETFRAYTDTRFKLLAEQRKRIELLGRKPPEDDLTDAQAEAELQAIALAGLKALPEEKRRELLALARGPDDESAS